MNTYKTCNVVMLPTNTNSDLILSLSDSKLYWKNGYFAGNKQHLYITSDEDIKEGDWIIHIPTSKIILNYNLDRASDKNLFKIIASTDPSIVFPVPDSLDLYPFSYTQKKYPQIPQSFIDYYINKYNKGNKIEKVEVEYIVDKYDIRNQYKDCLSGKYWMDEPIPPSPDVLYTNAEYYIPKTNSDNTINIKPIKESWNKEEVKQKFRDFRRDVLPFGQISDHTLNEWISKNL